MEAGKEKEGAKMERAREGEREGRMEAKRWEEDYLLIMQKERRGSLFLNNRHVLSLEISGFTSLVSVSYTPMSISNFSSCSTWTCRSSQNPHISNAIIRQHRDLVVLSGSQHSYLQVIY